MTRRGGVRCGVVAGFYLAILIYTPVEKLQFIIIFHIKPHLVRSAPDGALHTGIESSKEMQADVKVTVWQHRYDFYFSKTYCERLSSGPPSYRTLGTFV